MTPEEREVRRKMSENELYKDVGPGLEALEEARIRGKEIAKEFNAAPLRDNKQRDSLTRELFGSTGKCVWVEPPIFVAYGKHTHVGDNVYLNCGTTLIDDSEIHIKRGVMFGPNVTITTAGHPLHPEERRTGYQFSAKVTIEEDVWIGANVTILPGVTIGAGSVIAAGAVVNANVPPMVVAGGVPARVIRQIGSQDTAWTWKEIRTLTIPGIE